MTLLSINQLKKPDKNELPKFAVGIDLGTTNSLVAFYQDSQNNILEFKGQKSIPSIVAYSINSEILVGNEAREKILDPNYTVISSSKRLMGKNTDDIKNTYNENIFNNIEATQILKYKTVNKEVSPIEVSAIILKKLKSIAEENLKTKIEDAVITVPAYFDDAARTATKNAAKLAGLNVLRLVNEPTAAALAYGLDQNKEGTYLIYDLGGGTFDISILQMTNGVFQVLATEGDNMLGGDDFDELIVKKFYNDYSDLSKESHDYLLIQARLLKEILSEKEYAFTQLDINNKNHNLTLSRKEFDQLISELVDQTIDQINNLLVKSNMSKDEIDGIVLVGGSTRILQIREKLRNFFGQAPLTDLNPDEIVALGASLQAANLTGKISNLLIDVTPLSLGIEVMGGMVDKIIERNTPLPASVERKFTTYVDNQTGIKFHIVQGEREMVKDCRSLAQFELINIPPMKAGFAKISVIFNVDVDGLLTVTARDDLTGNTHQIEVKPSYGL
ncbi:MAG: Fe-S protein assembly chaperone HscA, partial [Alphaproteobacteria bacterium]